MKSISNTHIITSDGSSTMLSARYGAHYHSLHGARTESEHVFIESGFMLMDKLQINLLEIGFGTGLNAALTAQRSLERGIKVNYHTLELYPLSSNEYKMLNYADTLPYPSSECWEKICNAPWGVSSSISDCFVITKINADFTNWIPTYLYHLVYFDAFAPNDQPEMWSRSQFLKLFNTMHKGGVLVTYCVKGEVKRSLTYSGFSLERLSGPPGKKHMLRAVKLGDETKR